MLQRSSLFHTDTTVEATLTSDHASNIIFYSDGGFRRGHFGSATWCAFVISERETHPVAARAIFLPECSSSFEAGVVTLSSALEYASNFLSDFSCSLCCALCASSCSYLFISIFPSLWCLPAPPVHACVALCLLCSLFFHDSGHCLVCSLSARPPGLRYCVSAVCSTLPGTCEGPPFPEGLMVLSVYSRSLWNWT